MNVCTYTMCTLTPPSPLTHPPSLRMHPAGCRCDHFRWVVQRYCAAEREVPPVLAKWARSISGTCNKPYATQVAGTVGGIVVNIVVHLRNTTVGDADGIVVASKEHMEVIIGGAEAVVATEGRVIKGWRAGVLASERTAIF